MEKLAFISLVDKYVAGTASAAERNLLEVYYIRLESKASTELTSEEEADIHSAIYSHIINNVTNPHFYPPERKARRGAAFAKAMGGRSRGGLRTLYRISATAAAVLIIISSYWIFFRKQSINSNQLKITASQILPGRDAAILTLSNGKNISLDSLSGSFTDESGVTAMNSNGLLSYSRNFSSNIRYHTLTTSRGNQYSIILPDGSKAMLNSASSISFPSSFAGATRNVRILYGEAYFEVARNKQKPFIVEVGGEKVEVLGTSFNINNYKEEGATATTLITGSIKISHDNTSKTLMPGQQAIYANGNYQVSSADIQKAIAWTTGFFEFDQMDLKSIMRQVSRWYDIDIIYETTYPSDARFGGRISRNLPLSNILKLLEANGVKFRLEGKKLIIQQKINSEE